MSKIIFLKNPSEIYTASFSQIGQHQIRLIFATEGIPDEDILLSGLYLINEYNSFIQTRRKDYKYIYRKYDDNPSMIELCNDGVKYTEPDPVVIPDPEPYSPSYEETLENKINELSDVCQNTIIYGLDINGQHFSYASEDQTNLKEIFDTVRITGLPMGYHADGQNCAKYSAEELINIYIQLTLNKYCQQTYFNQSREYLMSLEKSDDNKKIVESYTYGTPLTGKFLDTYNTMVNLYDEQIQAMLLL